MKSANNTLKMLFTAMFLIVFTLSIATAETLTMPTDLQVIGEEAFYDDISINRVVLPAGIQRIEARAFARSGLKRINLPATLEYIAPDAFDGCSDFVCTGTADSYASRYCEKLDIPFVPYPEPVSQISLNASQTTLEVGDSYKIVVAYLPSNASYQYAYFSVDNNCVSIDDAGVITAQSQGSALVTVTAADGSRKTATISVTVNESPMISVASSGNGNTRTISITANKDWSVKSDAAWISLNQTRGSSGTSSITATLAVNPSTTASRSGTVTFTCGTKIATVIITQAAADSVSINPTAQAGGNPDGGGINPTITANGDWTAVSDSSWLTLSQTSGSSGSTKVNMTYAKNTSTTSRTATVTVTCGTAKATYKLTQDAHVITASISGSGNTRTISVSGNGSWTATANVTWITLSKTSGSNGTSSITATLSANPSTTASRSGTVTFTCGTKTATVTITQAAADSVSISPTAQAGGNPDGGGISPTITANGAWTAVSDSSWLTLSKTSGSSGSTKVDMVYAKNTSAASRTATVTVTCGTAKATYKLTQNAHTITASVSGSGNTRTISVSGNGSWTAKADVTWISLNKTNGSSGTSSITATLAANPSTTASRSGTVTLTCGAKTATVTITQDKSSVAVTGVSLNKSTVALKIGGTVTLTATVAPSNATNKSVTWSSSNTSVATVSNGTVTGKTAGTATITVKTSDSSKTATCTVTVYGKPAISFTSYPTSVTTSTTGVDIVAKVTGGKGPYTGYWTMYKSGTRENGTNTYTISTNTTNWPINQFGSAGSFQAELTITDALGQTVSAKTGTMTVTVPDTITATASGSGNTRTISVTANGSWTAKSNATWITLNKTNGSSGTSSVTATLVPNPSATASRSGTVTFTCGTKTTTVTITQAKPVAITAGPTVSVKLSGKTATFTWSSVANADYYDIEIYTVDNWYLMRKENGSVSRFSHKKEGLTTTSYTITLGNGNYVAQVSARNAASWYFSEPAQTARVTVGGVAVTSGPVPSATVSNSNVTLSWAHVSNALWYDVEIYTTANWDLMLSEGGSIARYTTKLNHLVDLSCTVSLPNGNYVAQIAGCNDSSYSYGWATPARFTVGTTAGEKVAQQALAYYNEYVSNKSIPVSTSTDWCARFANKCITVAGYSGHSTSENVVYQIQSYGTRFHVTYPGAKTSGYVWSNSSYFNPTASQVSVDPNYIPQVGDLIYFETMGTASDGPDHVGVVYAVSGSTVYCIEGNWNGGKMGKTSYNWKTAKNSSGYYKVWGFAHPDYH